MGLEYPYLAIMATAIFLAIIIGALFTTVWIEYQMRLTPHLEGYASFEWVSPTDASITIAVRVTSGTPVTYSDMLLPTNRGVVRLGGPGSYTLNNSVITVSFEGFDGTLHVGQEARILVNITNAASLFTPGKLYQALVEFENGGGLIVSFQPPPP